MLQSDYKELIPSTRSDLTNKIKQLLQYQRYAIRRATSVGMTRQEATEMEARIDQIEELLDRLHARLAQYRHFTHHRLMRTNRLVSTVAQLPACSYGTIILPGPRASELSLPA